MSGEHDDVDLNEDTHREGTAEQIEDEHTHLAVGSRPAKSSSPDTAPSPHDATIQLVRGTLVGEYEIEKLLGVGGMGEVYGARHERLGKRAAIKVISPSLCGDASAVERFEQEAHALARVSHPNIVSVTSLGALPDGRSYYIMEWLDGESLFDRLSRGPMMQVDAVDILDQIARGLEAAHAAGIVHRDLKPENVWLQRVAGEPRPIVKILDFGLAKLVEHRRSTETVAGVMFGTSAYMSPEQCESARDVGPPTDVYALGVVGYELLCGRLAFDYDNGAELIVAHQTETPPHPRRLAPHLAPALGDLLFAMLAKAPRERPTLATVRATIAETRTRFAASSAAPPVHVVARRSRRAIVLGAGVAAAAIVVVIVLVAVLASRDRTDDRDGAVPARAAEIDAGAIAIEPAPQLATPIDARLTDVEVHAAIPVDAGTAAAVDAVTVTPPTRTRRSIAAPRRPAREIEPPAPVDRPASPARASAPPKVDKDRTFNPFTGSGASR